MSEFERRATSVPVMAGWAVAVGGGLLLVLSGFAGGSTVTLAGAGVALLGFALVGLGLRASAPAGAAPRPAARSQRALGPRPNFVPKMPADPGPPAAPSMEEPEPAPAPTPSYDEGSPTPVWENPTAVPTASPMAISLLSAGAPEMPPEPDPEPNPPASGGTAEPRPPSWALGPSLPFAAATSRSQAISGTSPPMEEPWPPAGRFSRTDLLEEVERLRQQVEELSTPVLVPGLSVLRSAPMHDQLGLVTRVPEPPSSHLGPRYTVSCVGCGDPASPGPTGESRCWGCGRPVCTTCFWKYGPGPGLHRCGSCVASTGSSSFSVSGGRAAPRRPGGFPSSEDSEWTEGL